VQPLRRALGCRFESRLCGRLQVGNVTQVLAQKASASKEGIGYTDGPNKPNMIIIRERK